MTPDKEYRRKIRSIKLIKLKFNVETENKISDFLVLGENSPTSGLAMQIVAYDDKLLDINASTASKAHVSSSCQIDRPHLKKKVDIIIVAITVLIVIGKILFLCLRIIIK